MENDHLERAYHEAVAKARSASVETQAALLEVSAVQSRARAVLAEVEAAQARAQEVLAREDAAVRAEMAAWAELKRSRAAGGEEQREE